MGENMNRREMFQNLASCAVASSGVCGADPANHPLAWPKVHSSECMPLLIEFRSEHALNPESQAAIRKSAETIFARTKLEGVPIIICGPGISAAVHSPLTDAQVDRIADAVTAKIAKTREDREIVHSLKTQEFHALVVQPQMSVADHSAPWEFWLCLA